MNDHIKHLYFKARKSGYTAAYALYVARTVDRFDALELIDAVRIVAEPEQESYQDVYGEISAEEADAINQLGCWIVCGQIHDPADGGWITVDSIGMCTGYQQPTSWAENWHVPDLMDSCIRAIQTYAI